MPISRRMASEGIIGCEEGRYFAHSPNNPEKNRKKSMIAVAHAQVFVHKRASMSMGFWIKVPVVGY